MFSRSLLAVLASLVASGLSIGSANARSIVCESNDRSTQHCAADTSGGVTLAVQYSKASCRQGSSWGYDNRGVWVANGCRAQFDLGDHRSSHSSNHDSSAAAALAIGLIGAAAIASHHDRERREDPGYSYDYRPVDPYGPYGGYGGGYSQYDHVTCESRDNRRKYCAANLRHGRVDLERQLSRTPCRFGQNWGWDYRGVWVDEGCRATFVIY